MRDSLDEGSTASSSRHHEVIKQQELWRWRRIKKRRKTLRSIKTYQEKTKRNRKISKQSLTAALTQASKRQGHRDDKGEKPLIRSEISSRHQATKHTPVTSAKRQRQDQETVTKHQNNDDTKKHKNSKTLQNRPNVSYEQA